MPENAVILQLTKSQALVLFEFLSRFSSEETLAIHDQAEERVLWNLCADLECLLVEPLGVDYAQKLSEARDEIRDKK